MQPRACMVRSRLHVVWCLASVPADSVNDYNEP